MALLHDRELHVLHSYSPASFNGEQPMGHFRATISCRATRNTTDLDLCAYSG
jgi:hypothetical protein